MTSRLKGFSFVVALAALCVSPAQATQGAGSGGGADVVVGPGKPMLADPQGLLQFGKPKDFHSAFSVAVREHFELILVGGILKAYDLPARTGMAKKIRDLVMNSDHEYYWVETLPNLPDCTRPVEYPLVSDPKLIQRVACTQASRTWIVSAIFDLLALDDQSLVLAHEGMRRLDISDQIIFRFTSGLRVALKHWNLQTAGTYAELTDSERDLIKDSLRAGLGLRQMSSFPTDHSVGTVMSSLVVWPNGGGFADTKVEIAPSARIAMGSFVREGKLSHLALVGRGVACENTCEVGEEAVLSQLEFVDYRIMSNRTRLYVGARSTVRNSKFFNGLFTIGESAVVENSRFENGWSGSQTIGPKVTIRDSEVFGDLKTGESCVIEKSKLSGLTTLGREVEIRNSKLPYALTLNDRVRLDDLEFSFEQDDGVTLAIGAVSVGQLFWFAQWSKELIFEAGTRIDLEGKPLCPAGHGKLSTANLFKKSFSFRSVGDLRSYCDKK